jgi:hypothetical protein
MFRRSVLPPSSRSSSSGLVDLKVKVTDSSNMPVIIYQLIQCNTPVEFSKKVFRLSSKVAALIGQCPESNIMHSYLNKKLYQEKLTIHSLKEQMTCDKNAFHMFLCINYVQPITLHLFHNKLQFNKLTLQKRRRASTIRTRFSCAALNSRYG